MPPLRSVDARQDLGPGSDGLCSVVGSGCQLAPYSVPPCSGSVYHLFSGSVYHPISG